MEDERVEKLKDVMNRVRRAIQPHREVYPGYPAYEFSFQRKEQHDKLREDIEQSFALLDDLVARRDEDIKEAVEAERAEIFRDVGGLLPMSFGHKQWENAIEAATKTIEQRSPVTDPATIRREAAKAERKRILNGLPVDEEESDV